MAGYTPSMRRLIEEFAKMPGIGPRTAERLAFYVLRSEKGVARALSDAVIRTREATRFCTACSNLSETELCDICSEPKRDRAALCIVENPADVSSIEKTGVFNGLYHCLLGALSPLEGIGPGDLKIDELVERIKKGGMREAIIATSPDTDGEATALYLIKRLKPLGIQLTRIATGVPMGTNLEYIDRASLIKAMEGRRGV